MEIIIDIETAPLTPGAHLSEEGNDIGALSPITGRITAIGWQTPTDTEITTHVSTDEKKILESFWSALKKKVSQNKNYYKFVGFNVKQFDIHFLLVRSLAQNVPIVSFMRNQTIDLRDVLNAGYSYMKKGKLTDYATLLGIENKHNNYTGADAVQLFLDGNLEELEHYLKQDVHITAELYKRCKTTNIL